MLPLFDNTVLGVDDLFSNGVAISPLDPNVALVGGGDSSIPPNAYIWKVDINSGEALGPAIPVEGATGIHSMTFDLTGETFGHRDQQGQIINLDPETGQSSLVGDPGLSGLTTGLAFHNNGSLYAIDGRSSDRLVILNPDDGSVEDRVGPLFISGPEGLAFLFTRGSARLRRQLPGQHG